MKKMKVFFVAAVLLLVTAGVFAGKSKYTSDYQLCYLNGSTYVPVAEAASGSLELVSPFTTSSTGTTPATISGFKLYLCIVTGPIKVWVQVYF